MNTVRPMSTRLIPGLVLILLLLTDAPMVLPATTAATPGVERITVRFWGPGGHCLMFLGGTATLKKSEGDSLELLFKNRCGVAQDLTIKPPTLPFSCSTLAVKVLPGKDQSITCTVTYAKDKYKVKLRQNRNLASELALDEVP